LKFNTKKILQALLFLGVGVCLLYLVFRVNQKNFLAQCELDGRPLEECDLIQKLFEDFQTIDWFWMAMVFVCFILSNVSRVIRWSMLIEPLGKKPSKVNLFLSIMLSYFANLGFPRIGEFVRAGVVAKYTDLPAEKVMGTVILDRLADLLIFLLLCLVVGFFQWKHLAVFLEDQGVNISGSGLAMKFGLLAIIAAMGILTLRFFVRTKSTNKILVKIQSIILGFWDGIKTIAKVKRVGWFIFHSLMIWVMFFLMTFLAFKTFPPTAHLGLEAGLTVFVFGALGFVIPSPGGMGSYHFFVMEALNLYGIPRTPDGFSFANIVFFALQIGCNVSLGLLALILLPIINKKTPDGELA
jgi:uncharacterized protein (TIRG00374 family)